MNNENRITVGQKPSTREKFVPLNFMLDAIINSVMAELIDVERNLDQMLVLMATADMTVVSVNSRRLNKTASLLTRVVEQIRQVQTVSTSK